ncbi:hypothetical protein HU200_027414 [Digitaria exilis]|uniref:Uncharacterized protein n=1 Tax=Digitaria exilis TaxID=1010633 RepID=A0A835BW28_9POAL|nr:hypothetical protein HU200_027414 [Digitaria exilis]
MERAEPSLKPEWLLRPAAVAVTALRPATSPRAGELAHVIVLYLANYEALTWMTLDDQGRGASRNRSSGRDRDRSSQQSSSRRSSGSGGSKRNDRDATGKSRGYSSFGRHNRERVQEKDPDFRDRESKLVQPEDPLRDGFESFSSCRSEKDRLNRTRSKVSVSNRSGVSLDNGNIPKKDTGGISFEREFPHLGSEDKNGKQEIARVPSPGISTPIQSIPLVTAEGWNSVLAEVPIHSDPSMNSISSTSSPSGSSKQTEVSNSGSALSMAETVMQSPLKISTAPQLSIDAQKIEERTMRQCILRPLTPSSNKISASNSLDKLKSKGARAGESNAPMKIAPQLSLQPSSSSRTPIKTELVKPSQSGSLQVLSREHNGTVNTAAKDSTNNPVSPVLGRSSSMEPMRKSVVNPKLKVGTNGLALYPLQGSFGDRKASAKDKLKFFELLRSKSVNGSSTAIESPSSLIDDQQNSCLDLSFKFTENGSSSCEEANSCEGSQRHSSDSEEIIPPSESHDVLDEGYLGTEVDDRDARPTPLPADTEDAASKKPQPDNAEDVLPVKPACINDSSMISISVDEANLPLEEAHPAHEFENVGAGGEEELNFLRSLGWDENEDVQPLRQEEIAACVSACSTFSYLAD